MKRKLSLFLCLMMVFCLIPAEAPALRCERVVQLTNAKEVPVMKGAGTGYRTVGTGTPGAIYPWIKTEGDWYLIQFNGTEQGYVTVKKAALIDVATGTVLAQPSQNPSASKPTATSKPTPTPKPTQKPSGGVNGVGVIVRITHSRTVNVRTGPGTEYSYICEVSPGKTFPYLGSKNGWHRILYDGAHTGYVSGSLTTVENGQQWEITGSDNSSGGGSVQTASYVSITHSSSVTVRSGPGNGYTYLCELPSGGRYPYEGTFGSWHKVIYDGIRSGYVPASQTTVLGAPYYPNGTWVDDTADDTVCSGCGGSGRCSACGGNGYTVSGNRLNVCNVCHGFGKCNQCK